MAFIKNTLFHGIYFQFLLFYEGSNKRINCWLTKRQTQLSSKFEYALYWLRIYSNIVSIRIQ